MIEAVITYCAFWALRAHDIASINCNRSEHVNLNIFCCDIGQCKALRETLHGSTCNLCVLIFLVLLSSRGSMVRV